MKVWGQLENAQFENKTSDYSAGPVGRMWWRTDLGVIKVDDGTNIRALLRNDSKLVIGNSGTSSQNIRLHRGAAGVLQFVSGADATAEGSLSTSLNQISARHETYTNAGKPAAGNAGRVIWVSDLAKLQIDNGSSWQNVDSGLSNAWVTAVQKTVADTPITIASSDIGTVYVIDTTSGAVTLNLPAPSNGMIFHVVDKKGTFLTNNVTLHRNASENIENVASDYVLSATYGRWTVFSDGTDWYLV